MAEPITPGILEGMRVVELSAFVAAPIGGMALAQLGADVIRIDPLGGGIDRGRWPVTDDGVSLYWAGLNKGKRSMAIDIRGEEGRALIRDLITAPGEDAGIVITNVSPRWLDYDSLVERRPDLIMVVLKGNPDGSIAVDYTVNAAAGYPAITGASDEPVNHVVPVWDLLAGSMITTAVLAADRRRRTTGEGALVSLSLADVALTTTGNLGQVAEVVVNDSDRPAFGNYVFGTFGKDFETGDGRRVMVVALTSRQWNSLVTATGLAAEMEALERRTGRDLANEGDRFELRTEIASLVGEWVGGKTLEEVQAAFKTHSVLWGPYATVRELVTTDPRVAPEVNPVWDHVDQPGIGSYPAPGHPLRFGAGVDRPALAAPQPGSDTGAVLAEVLGMSIMEIESLAERDVL